MRFRYREKYVAERARKLWRDDGLFATPVLVLFALQHPADFYDSVFAPLRGGSVVKTFVEGEIYVVEFKVGAYLPLAEQGEKPREHSQPVKVFSAALKTQLGADHPASVSAALGPNPQPLLAELQDATKAFAIAARFVVAMLPLGPRTFWRLSSITDDAKRESVPLTDGLVELTAERRYTIEIVHYQPVDLLGPSSFTLTPPAGTTLIGDANYSIRSNYDVVPIRFFVPASERRIAGQLRVTTDLPAIGPTVRIPTVVRPTVTQNISGPVLGIGGAMALALPGALAAEHHALLTTVLVTLGSAAVGIGLWWRRYRGLGN